MQDYWLILFIVCTIALFIVIGKTSKGTINPVKWLWMGVINTLIGAMGLYFFNLLGSILDFNMPINLITASIVGVLGLPGLVSLILAKFLIGI